MLPGTRLVASRGPYCSGARAQLSPSVHLAKMSICKILNESLFQNYPAQCERAACGFPQRAWLRRHWSPAGLCAPNAPPSSARPGPPSSSCSNATPSRSLFALRLRLCQCSSSVTHTASRRRRQMRGHQTDVFKDLHLLLKVFLQKNKKWKHAEN